MGAFHNGQSGELTNNNGVLQWWINYVDPQTGITGIGELKMLKLHRSGSNSNYEPNFFGGLVDKGFDWVQNHPKEVTSIAGIIEGSSQLIAKGLRKWNASSSLTKSSIFAETISTKLPFSAQTLGKASTAFNIAGKVVGTVGIANTLYQMNQGNISNSRGTVDLIMGVAGFFPATAPISLLYFGGIAIYEYYSQKDFLSKDEYY